MRDALIIAVTCVLAILLGTWLYASEKGPVPEVSVPAPVSFTVLAEGQDSGSIEERRNYRVRSMEELTELWRLAYPPGGPEVPAVDFERSEVLAVFDGTHTTGGYAVAVTAIEDSGLTRTVSITHTVPGASCMTATALSSPFQMVVVEKSALSITREEETVEVDCR